MVDISLNDASQEVAEVTDQLKSVRKMIKEEEKRYQMDDVSIRTKVEQSLKDEIEMN